MFLLPCVEICFLINNSLRTIMNYRKIYKNLIMKAKNENRKKSQGTYYESHHVVPDFLFKIRKRKGPRGYLDGDSSCPNNKVLLTAREHLVAHLLLYKILKGTHYEYAAGSSLVFFVIKNGGTVENNIHPRIREFVGYAKKYERIKKLAAKCTSERNKGWINVRNSKTGEYFGRMSVLDNRYTSGEFVHHTKGRIISDEEKVRWGPRGGENNANYKELTSERKERIFDIISTSIEAGTFIKKLFMRTFKEKFVEFKKVSDVFISNKFGSFEKMIEQYNIERDENIKFNPYYRTLEHKQKMRESNNLYIWITNGIESIRVKKDFDIPEGYKRGRTC